MSYEERQAAIRIEPSSAIEMLRLKMAQIEASREVNLGDGMSDADASLFAGWEALRAVSEILLNQTIECRPINRLLIEISDIIMEARPSDIFAYRGRKGRPREKAMVEEVKGHLAAIAEFRQEAGLTRRSATEWVARHLSKPLQTALRNPKPRTIDSWLLIFGDACNERRHGRRGYLSTRDKLGEKPSEQVLIQWMRQLERYLPPRAESD